MEKQYANFHGYSDVEPFEILSRTAKTITIREMDAELINKEELNSTFVPGGFCGHFENHVQKWEIKSNENNITLKAYLRKDGNYYSKKGRHVISDTPCKFYDYNF